MMVTAGIPAFNEEAQIAKVVVQAKKHVDKVVLCDDGSYDMTAEIAASVGAEVIRHERNMGYGASLASLFRKARADDADVLVTLDADGQHDPSQIDRVIEPIVKGEADVVIGSRFMGDSSESIPRYREVGIRAITLLSSVSGQRITDAQSGFRAYGRKAIASLTPTEMGMGASTELISKAVQARLRVAEVPVTVSYAGNTSTHNPVYHGFDVVFATVKHLSIRHPLLFYGAPGGVLLIIAVGFWWWTLTLFAETHKMVTNVALIAVASTIVGLILMAVAVILWVIISVIRER